METPRWHPDRAKVAEDRDRYPLDVPLPSLDERDRRWNLLREKMLLRGYDALVFIGTDFNTGMGMANIRYVTGVGASVGAFAAFGSSGEPVVFTGAPHMHLPLHASLHIPGHWVEDVRPKAGVGAIVDWLSERGLARRKLGVVGYRDGLTPQSNTPATFLDELRRGLPGVELVDETAMIDELRLIKSAEEIAFLERAGEIARLRVEKEIATARPGATEAEVWAAMEYEAIVNGAEANTFNVMSSGPTADPEGRLMYLLHGSETPYTHTSRVLQEGDLIVGEFHTSYAGYLAATEFSVFLGQAPTELKNLHQLGVDIIQMATRLFQPGARVGDISDAFQRHIEDAGCDFVELGFHGHGLGSPEFPTVVYRPADQEYMAARGVADIRLREGMVFGINIDIHDPRWRKDAGIMIGDMLVVESGGGRLLCNIPLDIFELPAK